MRFTPEELARAIQNSDVEVVDERAILEQPPRTMQARTAQVAQTGRLRIVIPDYRPQSWNRAYAGQHWSQRKAVADEAHTLVRSHLPHDVQPFAGPVDITVTAYFKSHPLDADNVAAKLLIDGLIGHVLVDDSPKFVRSVRTVSVVDKHAPRVVIDVVAVAQ